MDNMDNMYNIIQYVQYIVFTFTPGDPFPTGGCIKRPAGLEQLKRMQRSPHHLAAKPGRDLGRRAVAESSYNVPLLGRRKACRSKRRIARLTNLGMC